MLLPTLCRLWQLFTMVCMMFCICIGIFPKGKFPCLVKGACSTQPKGLQEGVSQTEVLLPTCMAGTIWLGQVLNPPICTFAALAHRAASSVLCHSKPHDQAYSGCCRIACMQQIICQSASWQQPQALTYWTRRLAYRAAICNITRSPHPS